MTPDMVVDIGNSRMKWGRVDGQQITKSVAMANDDPAAWQVEFDKWPQPVRTCLVSGVVPATVKRLSEWLTARGVSVTMLDNATLLGNVQGFRTTVAYPDRIGTDRLLNALATHREADPGCSAVAISVGTAMTVDFVQADGTHVGGAILPGLDLMAKSLHLNTAQLPLLNNADTVVEQCYGVNTEEAISLGLQAAILGAADRLVCQWATNEPTPCVCITGGGFSLFDSFDFSLDAKVSVIVLDSTLTLNGLRIVAESLP